jgi:hypothetical protein
VCAVLPEQVCSHCFEPEFLHNCDRCDALMCESCVGGCHYCDEMLCSSCTTTAEFKVCQSCGMLAFTVTTCTMLLYIIMLNITFVMATEGFSCRGCRVNCKICFETKLSISSNAGKQLEMLQDLDHLRNLCPNLQCTFSCGIYRSIYIDRYTDR